MITQPAQQEEYKPILIRSHRDPETMTTTYDTPEPFPQRTAFSPDLLKGPLNEAVLRMQEDADGQLVLILLENGRATYRLDTTETKNYAGLPIRKGTLLYAKWQPPV